MTVGPPELVSEDGEREITHPTIVKRPPHDDWDAIVERWDHRVIVSLLAMNIPLERARELAQTTWMRLFEQHREGRLDKLQFPGLALTQARYLALDHLRHAKHETARFKSFELDAPTIPDASPNPERRLLSREEADRALDVIAGFPPNAQRIFRLTYEDPSMPHAEIAEKVGLSVQRVRQILCELRKKVRAALDAEVTHD